MTEQSSFFMAEFLIPDVCNDKTRETNENGPKLFPNKNSLLLNPWHQTIQIIREQQCMFTLEDIVCTGLRVKHIKFSSGLIRPKNLYEIGN